jgi:ribosomal protein S18 acetylase RimI-like enzyme
MTLIIRPIATADETRWRELFVAYGVFYKTEFTQTILDGVWAWLMHPSHPVSALVAESDGAVIGFAMFREHPDTFSAGPSLYLDDLYVDPAARGKGAATALIEAVRAEAKARSITEVRWQTSADNFTAQRVYDKLAKKADWITYELDAN